jgi:hypothetical protein
MGVPLYRSKFSKRTFTVHQHLLMHAVKQLEKETYRGLIDRLDDSKAVEALLGLPRMPHYTTPQKFLKRVPKRWLHLLLKRMVDLLASAYYNAVDATCFRLRAASAHYVRRLGEALEVKDYLKAVDLLEVRTGLFVASKGIRGWRHEAPHLVPAVRRLPRTAEVYGDKAFDGEAIHRQLQELGVEGYIDVKGGANAPARGLRLAVATFQEEHPDLWGEKYGLRPRIESAYHALKAVTGDVLPGRTWWMVDRYRAIRYFAFNLYVLARDHSREILSFLFVYGRIMEEDFYKPAFPYPEGLCGILSVEQTLLASDTMHISS